MDAYSWLRPLFFRLPAETAHEYVTAGLRAVQSVGAARRALSTRYTYRHPALEVECFDTTFDNPVGVAAGFDKNARVFPALDALGFGFVEVGTVTPEPQAGNPRPRLFRLPKDRALVNRMGFNGDGVDRVRDRLETNREAGGPIGVNVGKMNDSDADEAIEDYLRVFEELSPYGEYFVVNVSCPNTPDEFDEDDPDHLRTIFETLQAANEDDAPLLVKIGPDSPTDSLYELVDIVEAYDLDGIVATNTTTSREGLRSTTDEWGGLSGKPLESRSTGVIKTIAGYTDLPIVGVGGVDSAESAYQKIRAGASLVQLYTGFVYNGPSTAREINRGLVERLHEDGFDTVSEAVGADLD
ncbi:quinone-dependent dihydroorotate dehydrogenase [Halovivax cerinus]|uniref:Dihydroorotate dehydrogenase (quinone) n=1 Tax=Halovivax cerinus TaxID=1487865 RepID=A0ABD5NMP4_9EURY|nr:quinone-dependent dihydroorotate dehydrogenase [Halovivax cerinus]